MIRLLTLLIIMLGLFIPTSQAQINTPVIINIDGDLWAWDGGISTQLTDWGFNGDPIISPDGTRVAYVSMAAVFVDWLQTISGAGGFEPPQNIWILDLPLRQTYRIADQPADAVYTGPESPGKYMLRSTPTWSPNGRQLAWLDYDVNTLSGQNEGTASIRVYDIVTGQSYILDSFTFTNFLSPSNLYGITWGSPGIAVFLEEDIVRIYHPTGSIISHNIVETRFDGWIEDNLFNTNSPDSWLAWEDLQTTASGIPEMYSLSAPDGTSFYLTGGNWVISFPNQEPIMIGNRVTPYSISPDGLCGLYGVYEPDPVTGFYAYTLTSYCPNSRTEIGRYNAIRPVWGAVGWRVKS